MKILAGVVISLFASLLAGGCARTPGNSLDPEEPVEETREAATPDIPRWRLFLSGPDLHPGDGGMVYYDQPRDSDEHGRVIAVRLGDEGKPGKWVRLSLEMQRRYGDGYFISLIANDKVTLTDLVVIDGLLLDAKVRGVEPPLISTLGGPVGEGTQRLRFEEPSQPSDVHPYLNGNIPGRGGSPGPNKGVTPGVPGPRRTGFCDGKPCPFGDTSGIEWKPVPVAEKWTVKLGRFFDTYKEGVRATLRREIFYNGRNPACAAVCSHLGAAAASRPLLCFAATDAVATGACMSGATGAITGGMSTLSGGIQGQWVQDYCNSNVCDPG